MEKIENPSLETLIEKEDVGFEIFHPGGIETTKELCSLISLKGGEKILEVGSGSGVTSCFLAKNFGCEVVGIDNSDYLVGIAKKKAEAQNLNASFILADAHHLPFENDSFDIVIAECVLTLLDKGLLLSEIHRVLKPDGIIGIHDICWTNSASEELKEQLYQLESEQTETLQGWKQLLEDPGFSDVEITEKPNLMSQWVHQIKKKLGLLGQLKLFFKVYKKWGFTGVLKIKQGEKLFADQSLSYFIAKAKKTL